MIKTKKHGWLRPKTRQDKAKAEAASEHLRETVEKLPSWAKPIVVKHLTKYLNIISDLDNADPKERARRPRQERGRVDRRLHGRGLRRGRDRGAEHKVGDDDLRHREDIRQRHRDFRAEDSQRLEPMNRRGNALTMLAASCISRTNAIATICHIRRPCNRYKSSKF